jgi:hypothetical protein
MKSESENQFRNVPDRRRTRTNAWSALLPGGRRIHNRRSDEHCQTYFVDRFPLGTLVLILLLLTFSISDAVITLILLEHGYEEFNPLMSHLLDRGLLSFLVGKYVLTAAGIPLLLVFKHYYLFGTRFRVGYLIPVFVLMYVVLIAYQLYLLCESRLL